MAAGDKQAICTLDAVAHALVMIPSVVSIHSWNLLIDVDAAAGQFKLVSSEAFALDPRSIRV